MKQLEDNKTCSKEKELQQTSMQLTKKFRRSTPKVQTQYSLAHNAAMNNIQGAISQYIRKRSNINYAKEIKDTMEADATTC